jgi:hypothetical protein
MGYQQPAASRGYDPAQIERDWTLAQARIDALAEAGTQAVAAAHSPARSARRCNA